MTLITTGWLIYQPAQEQVIASTLACAQSQGVNLQPVVLADFLAKAPTYLDTAKHLVCLLESTDLGPLLHCAHQHAATIGLLPVHAKSKVCRLFDIAPTIGDAMPLALQRDTSVPLDLLLCNDEAVTWMVTLGEVPFIELRQIADEDVFGWQRIKTLPASIRMLFSLQPKSMTLTTGKDATLKTAVIGAMVIENDIKRLMPCFANETASVFDGKLSIVLVAPASIIDYLSFLLAALSPRPRLPKATSYIKTAQLRLESTQTIDFYIDGQHRQAPQIDFRVIPKALQVNVGPALAETHPAIESDKDIIKVKTLPQGEERLRHLKQHLPLFSTAQESDFKEVFITLRDYAQLSVPFTLLMVLSALLATFGLFLNNAPVVIGAMLLAPLMGPIVSMAMGLLRNDDKLLRGSLNVFLIGTGLTILVAASAALLLPYEQATDEIRARLLPNLLDLGVAVVSGIAAAYAHARENVQKSLAGVAIAVALVPPACVIGIGVGWMDWTTVSGAGLLFLTNLVGIALAAMFTFLILGFTPDFKVNRNVGLSVILAALISIPLYHAFMNTVVYDRFKNTLSTQTYQTNGKTLSLSNLSLQPEGDKIKILAEVHSTEILEAKDITALRDFIAGQLDEPVVLDVSLRLVQ